MLKNLIYFMDGMEVLKQPYQNQNCLQCSNKSILDKIIQKYFIKNLEGKYSEFLEMLVLYLIKKRNTLQ